MHTLKEIMAEQPFFAGLDQRWLQTLTDHAANAFYETNTYIFKEGDQAGNFYILREGRIALETFVAGRGDIVIETIEAGEVLGWSWLFPPYRWHFSARVVEPTRAIALDGACLRSKGEEDHELGYQLVKRVAQIMMQRLQATRLQLLDVYHGRA